MAQRMNHMTAKRYLGAVMVALAAWALLITAAAAQNATVFDNVTIHTMSDQGMISRGRVVVEGDRITAVGPASRVIIPTDAMIVDGNGGHLVPGLTEMHGHIPSPTNERQLIDDTLFLYVSRGVTTVRGMLGHPGQLALKDDIADGDIIGPTLYLAGPSFNGNSVNSPEQADQRVRAQAAEGWDLLKVHPGLTRAEYDAMASAAHETGMRFAGHVPADVGLQRALDAGQDTIEHLDGYLIWADALERPLTEADLDRAAEATLAAGSAVVPTNSIWQTLVAPKSLEEYMAYDELKYMPSATRENWFARHARDRTAALENAELSRLHDQNRTRLLGGLAARGVTVLMGSDAPQLFSVPGFSIHREIDMMIEAGMSPAAILESGTVAPGQYFANEDQFGIIAPGWRADLILLTADPTADARNLRHQAGVMAQGRWLSAADIQTRLDEIEARNR